MRILIGTTVLCDGQGKRGVGYASGPSGFRLDGQPQVQPVQRIRATSVIHYDRGNFATTVSFTVSRLHSSVAAAEAFVLSHYRGLPTSGTAMFETKDTDGTLTRVTMANAKLVARGYSYRGCSTTHTYQIVGGITA